MATRLAFRRAYHGALALVVLIATLSSDAPAGKPPTLHVANNGVDSPGCGTSGDPCRSISQAIAVAPDGASIEVGPGRYGDLDGDGALDLPGEEAGPIGPPCFCLIRVDKPLRIYSRDGPALTVIRGVGTYEEIEAVIDVVRIEADGVVFGSEARGGRKARRSNGFTLTNGGYGALVATADGVTIAGNVAVRNDVGFIALASSGTVFERNVAVANEWRGISFDSDGGVMRENVAIANDYGLTVYNDGVSILDNVATGNRSDGLYFQTEDCVSLCRVQGNVLAGNAQYGITINAASGDVEVSHNSVIGNFSTGIRTVNAHGVYRENNIFGNDRDGSGACGFWNGTGTALDAPGHFWGDPAGRGGDPADGACGAPVTTSTIATSEIPVGPATPLAAAKKTKRRR